LVVESNFVYIGEKNQILDIFGEIGITFFIFDLFSISFVLFVSRSKWHMAEQVGHGFAIVSAANGFSQNHCNVDVLKIEIIINKIIKIKL
jgi:hypothetical protein